MIIKLDGISKRFGNTTVLDKVNLEIEKGEVLIIIGGSGGGKSVLLNIMLGFLKPDDGKVLFISPDKNEEMNLAALNEEELLEVRKNFGVLFQGSALFDNLTVGENIAFPLEQKESPDDKELEGKVTELMEKVGLHKEKDINKFPSDLSGGMQKRVAFARAVAHNPSVLFFDEPTSGLDPDTSKNILELILKATADSDKTSIVITHELEPSCRIASRIFEVKNGNLIERVTKEEIKEIRKKYNVEENEVNIEAGREIKALLDEKREKDSVEKKESDEIDRKEEHSFISSFNIFPAVTCFLKFTFSFLFKGTDLNQTIKRILDIGVSSLKIIAPASIFMGMVLALQMATGLERFGAKGMVATMVCVSMLREIGPILTALLLAGRAGASISAELGSMVLSQQIDALKSFGVNPLRYLINPVMIAALLCVPILTIFSYTLGIIGGYVIGVLVLQIKAASYISNTMEAITAVDFFCGLFKSVFFALTIGSVACYFGMKAKKDSQELGKATTASVWISSLIVIFLDLLLTQIYIFFVE